MYQWRLCDGAILLLFTFTCYVTYCGQIRFCAEHYSGLISFTLPGECDIRLTSINRSLAWRGRACTVPASRDQLHFWRVIETASLLSPDRLLQQTSLRIVLQTKSRSVWKIWHQCYYDLNLHAGGRSSFSSTEPAAQNPAGICLLNGLDR